MGLVVILIDLLHMSVYIMLNAVSSWPKPRRERRPRHKEKVQLHQYCKCPHEAGFGWEAFVFDARVLP